MDYDLLSTLRRHHPAWRLLAADTAPFVIGFLCDCFIRPNVRALSEDDRIVTRSGTQLLRDTDYLLFLKPVANSKSFTLAQEPIPSQPQWDLVLPFAALPPELKMREVTFDTFVEDLQLAVLACAGSK